MKPKKGPSVTELLESFAGDVVQIQKKLDDRFIIEANQFVADYLSVPEDHRTFLMPSAPQRQVLAKHEVSARIAWRKEKSIEASLSVSLLNLSADIRFQRETSTDSSITIEIEQIPLTENLQNHKTTSK
ncbi:MAG: hypothetical protein AAF502_11205 [Bacteroidota bacterium]